MLSEAEEFSTGIIIVLIIIIKSYSVFSHIQLEVADLATFPGSARKDVANFCNCCVYSFLLRKGNRFLYPPPALCDTYARRRTKKKPFLLFLSRAGPPS